MITMTGTGARHGNTKMKMRMYYNYDSKLMSSVGMTIVADGDDGDDDDEHTLKRHESEAIDMLRLIGLTMWHCR